MSNYYPIWIENCLTSAEYCIAKGDLSLAEDYIIRAKRYLKELREVQE